MVEQDDQKDSLEEEDLEQKVPARYKDLWDSDGFEKFRKNKDWMD